MNLVSYLKSLFTGHTANGELEDVREVAREKARLMGEAFCQEFESELGKVFVESHNRLIGFKRDEPKQVEAQVSSSPSEPTKSLPDYSDWDRPALMREAKEKGLSYDRTVTKDDLVEMLSSQ